MSSIQFIFSWLRLRTSFGIYCMDELFVHGHDILAGLGRNCCIDIPLEHMKYGRGWSIT